MIKRILGTFIEPMLIAAFVVVLIVLVVSAALPNLPGPAMSAFDILLKR